MIQKLILKIILKRNATYPSDQLFAECCCLNVNKLYILESILFINKNIYTYNYPSHLYTTRSVANSNLSINKYNKTSQQNFIDYQGPLFYS